MLLTCYFQRFILMDSPLALATGFILTRLDPHLPAGTAGAPGGQLSKVSNGPPILAPALLWRVADGRRPARCSLQQAFQLLDFISELLICSNLFPFCKHSAGARELVARVYQTYSSIYQWRMESQRHSALIGELKGSCHVCRRADLPFPHQQHVPPGSPLG